MHFVRILRFNNVLPLQEQTQGEQEFYEKSGSSDDDEDDEEEMEKKEKKNVYIMDPDHRLLLRTCKPLLQSRNASVSTGTYLSLVISENRPRKPT